MVIVKPSQKGPAGSGAEKYAGSIMSMKLMFALKHTGFSDVGFVSFFSVKQSDPHAQFISLPVHLLADPHSVGKTQAAGIRPGDLCC